VHLCTSNHFTDDPVGLGGTATITAPGGTGVVVPSRAFTTLGWGSNPGSTTPDVVLVECVKVWEAPAGLVGTVTVTFTVTSARPGSAMAKVFTYTNAYLNPSCHPAGSDPATWVRGRCDFSDSQDWYEPNWFTGAVTETVDVSATNGANVWFKQTYAP
jgi:hypothetical protein